MDTAIFVIRRTAAISMYRYTSVVRSPRDPSMSDGSSLCGIVAALCCGREASVHCRHACNFSIHSCAAFASLAQKLYVRRLVRNCGNSRWLNREKRIRNETYIFPKPWHLIVLSVKKKHCSIVYYQNLYSNFIWSVWRVCCIADKAL